MCVKHGLFNYDVLCYGEISSDLLNNLTALVNEGEKSEAMKSSVCLLDTATLEDTGSILTFNGSISHRVIYKRENDDVGF